MLGTQLILYNFCHDLSYGELWLVSYKKKSGKSIWIHTSITHNFAISGVLTKVMYLAFLQKYHSRFWEWKMKISWRWNWVVESVWVWTSTAWSTCEGGRLCWCLPRGGLTDNIHVLCFRCLWKKPLSRDLIHIHMQFNRPCKNKIKRNYIIYQTLQNY